jgi:hypothetical protein
MRAKNLHRWGRRSQVQEQEQEQGQEQEQQSHLRPARSYAARRLQLPARIIPPLQLALQGRRFSMDYRKHSVGRNRRLQKGKWQQAPR